MSRFFTLFSVIALLRNVLLQLSERNDLSAVAHETGKVRLNKISQLTSHKQSFPRRFAKIASGKVRYSLKNLNTSPSILRPIFALEKASISVRTPAIFPGDSNVAES